MFRKLWNVRPDAFGLDVSDFSLKIARLSKKKELVSFGEFPIEQGAIDAGQMKDEKKLVEIIRKAYQNIQGSPLDTAYVIASLPEEKAFLQVVQLPRMKREDIRAAVSFEAENYVPYPLDTVYLDYEVVIPLRDHLNHLDVLIAALPKETVDSYMSALDQAGLIPIALEIESLSMFRAVVKDGISPVPILVADIGATRTSLSVFAGRSLRFTTSLPISSAQFTEAIQKNIGISLEEAEQKKRAFGIAFPQDAEGEAVFEALVPSLTDLAEQMRKYVEYYSSHAKHQHLRQEQGTIQKILLCGGGANLKGLAPWIAGNLGVAVELGNPWVNILSESAKSVPLLRFEESLGYTTALGLALRGIAASDYAAP